MKKSGRKEAFLFHVDYINREELTTEEVGILTLAMISYAEEGTEPDLEDRALRMEWSRIRKRMDADIDAYEQKCQVNRENGSKGGRPRKGTERLNEKPRKTERFSEKPKKPDIDTDIDIDIDNDIESESNYINNNIYTTPAPSDHDISPNVTKPALNDIKQFCFLKGLRTNADAFYYHYAAQDWKDASGRSLDWRNKILEWDAKDRGGPHGSGTPRNGFNNFRQRDYDYDALETALMRDEL